MTAPEAASSGTGMEIMLELELLKRYQAGLATRDFDLIESCRHPDFQSIWPQTGERVVGHDADRRIHESYPGYPDHDALRMVGHEARFVTPRSPTPTYSIHPILVTGGGDLWVGQQRLTYGSGETWLAILVVEMLAGLVHRETAWFGPILEPPEWRADLVEPLEARAPAGFLTTTASPGATATRKRAMEAFAARLSADPDTAIGTLFHDDSVWELPQSGERIVGAGRIAAAHRADPHQPAHTLRRALAVGDLAIVELHTHVDDERSWTVGIADFEGERVRRMTAYRIPRQDAPAWRAEWVELLADDER